MFSFFSHNSVENNKKTLRIYNNNRKEVRLIVYMDLIISNLKTI